MNYMKAIDEDRMVTLHEAERDLEAIELKMRGFMLDAAAAEDRAAFRKMTYHAANAGDSIRALLNEWRKGRP